MFGNRPYCTVGDVESEGDNTMFSVTFGRVRTLSFGDKIQSSPIKAGGSSWIVVYFPKVARLCPKGLLGERGRESVTIRVVRESEGGKALL